MPAPADEDVPEMDVEPDPEEAPAPAPTDAAPPQVPYDQGTAYDQGAQPTYPAGYAYGYQYAPQPAPYGYPPPPATRVPWYAKACIALVIVVGIGGFFHIVHGGSVGCAIVTKEEWGLDDTFVDVDDYVGKSVLELAASGKAKVVRVLLREGYIRLPERDKE